MKHDTKKCSRSQHMWQKRFLMTSEILLSQLPTPWVLGVAIQLSDIGVSKWPTKRSSEFLFSFTKYCIYIEFTTTTASCMFSITKTVNRFRFWLPEILGFQDIIVRSLKFSTEVFSWVLNPSFLSLKLTNKIRADLQEYLQGLVVFNTSLSSVLQFVFFPIFFFLLLNLSC